MKNCNPCEFCVKNYISSFLLTDLTVSKIPFFFFKFRCAPDSRPPSLTFQPRLLFFQHPAPEVHFYFILLNCQSLEFIVQFPSWNQFLVFKLLNLSFSKRNVQNIYIGACVYRKKMAAVYRKHWWNNYNLDWGYTNIRLYKIYFYSVIS